MVFYKNGSYGSAFKAVIADGRRKEEIFAGFNPRKVKPFKNGNSAEKKCFVGTCLISFASDRKRIRTDEKITSVGKLLCG